MPAWIIPFFAGVGTTVVLVGIATGIWRMRKRRDPYPEVRDAPLPSTVGTADPFAQHWSQRLLQMLDWKRYEEVIATYIKHLGFETKRVNLSENGLLDLHGFEPGRTAPAMLVRCTAWDRGRLGEETVREFHTAMVQAGIGQGAFFNTGGFTQPAEQFVADKEIDLVNGPELLDRLGQLPLDTQNQLLDFATDGDYATPTCPACNAKMVRRVTVNDAQAGVYFWGCRNYPRCRQIFGMS
jgi:restriction system protein